MEPKGPIITVFDPEATYCKAFYDRYVDLNEQPFNATECRFDGCKCTFDAAYKMRRHYLSHFDRATYEKFKCARCLNN